MKTNEKIVRAVLKIVNPEAEALLTPEFVTKYRSSQDDTIQHDTIWDNYLMNAFTWRNTPQKATYWIDVNNQISDYLREHPAFNPDTPVGHPHAELMAQYAEAARTDPKPWERFEYAYNHTKGYWNKLTTHPAWETNVNYRSIPATSTCTLAGITFPKPVRERLTAYKTYYLINLAANRIEEVKEGHLFNSGIHATNLVQATEEGAKQQLLAMQTALQQAVDSHE